MRNKWLQLKIVFFPYIFFSSLAVSVTIFLKWFFEVYLQLFAIRDDIYVFAFSWTIPFGVIYLISDRIKVLKIIQSNFGERYGVHAIMGLPIFLILLSTFFNIDKLFFDVVNIRTVQEYPILQKEKFLKISTFKLDKSKLNYELKVTSLGRYSSDYSCQLYVTLPFKNGNDMVWYGQRFLENVPGYLSENERKTVYEDFWQRNMNELLQSSDFELKEGARYFEKENYGSHRDNFIKSIVKLNPDLDSENAIILTPQRVLPSQKLKDEINNISWTITGLITLVFCLIFFSKPNQKELKKYLGSAYNY